MAAYLDDALPQTDRRKLARHLLECPHCGEYLRQLRTTIAATGRVDTEELSRAMCDALVAVYRKTLHPG